MKNSVAMVLRILGILEIIVGLICGLVFARRDIGTFTEVYVQEWSITFIWWIAGFVSGMMFIGSAEIIELLNKINIKLENKLKSNNDGFELLN